MQAAEKERKKKEEEQGLQAQEAQLFDFKPSRARSVPDFQRLTREFIAKME
jgi:hypothetical protein